MYLCAFVHFDVFRFQSFRRVCCFGVCFVLYSSFGQMNFGVTKIQSLFMVVYGFTASLRFIYIFIYLFTTFCVSYITGTCSVSLIYFYNKR